MALLIQPTRQTDVTAFAARHVLRPTSVRFLGDRFYAGTVVVLMYAMGGGVANRRIEQLRHVLGVHRRTVQRWQHWWRTVFAATPFWTMARGVLMPAANSTARPASLLERFVGPDDATRPVHCLRFLAPLHSPYGDHEY